MQRACQLGRIESRDVAERDQRAVLWAHAGESIAKVDVANMRTWIRRGRCRRVACDRDLEYPTPAPTP